MSFSPDQVYDVVADVGNYHLFVPWCNGSRVLRSDGQSLDAELDVGFGLFSESYVSHVDLLPPKKVKAQSNRTSLLEFLVSEWEFSPAGDPKHCWVTFKIEFKFKSSIYDSASQLFLSEVVENMVQAFNTRCHRIYGRK